MKWYLAGQMSGIPSFNFPRFMYAAALLRSQGFDVINPAELDDDVLRNEALASKAGSHADVSTSWGFFLSRDVRIIADDVNGIILLDDWRVSRGACLEAHVGLLCGHQFMMFRPDNHLSVPCPVLSVGVAHMLMDSLKEIP